MNRQVGVRTPDSQNNTGTGEPSKVYHVVPMEVFAIEYTDEFGKKHSNIAYMTGGVVYLAPEGERWAASLKQASKYVTDAVLSSRPSKNTTVPQQDDVDVMGGGLSAGQEAPQ